MLDECQDEVRPECRVELREIHAELMMIRSAVIGNGGKGIKDTVAAHGLALKIIGAAVAIIAAAVLTAALGGCIPSSAETISARLTDVQQAVTAAGQSVRDARRAVTRARAVIPADSPAMPSLDTAVGHLDTAEGHIGTIGEATADAQRELPNVEDKATWFDKLTGAVVWVAGAVVAVILFIVGRRLFGWLPSRETRRDAEMARKVLDGADEATAKEMIAARRGADPGFDRAFRKTSRPPPANA